MNAELSQALSVIETGLDDVLGDLQDDCTTQDRETLASYIRALQERLDALKEFAAVTV